MRQPTDSTLRLFASLTRAQRERLLRVEAERCGVPVEQLKAHLAADWRFIGRPKQQAPDGDWTYWYLIAGRGFGKTMSAAQWAARKAREQAGVRFALVAPIFADGRDVMVEGETGLLSVFADGELRGGTRATAWNRSAGELFLANGSRFKVYSSEEPDRLRGPQHHYAWCEEVSSWKDAHRGDALESTWSNLKLGTRLGGRPQIALTSTPKPNRLTKQLIAIDPPRMVVVKGSSYENRDNLSEAWWSEVIEPYEGTRLGRQEIYAELLEDVEGALWGRAQIEELRTEPGRQPQMERVVVAVDPNVTSGEAANAGGVVVCGRGTDGHGYVLGDYTTLSGGPRQWARSAVQAYHLHHADRIVAESNNGGEMVKLTILTVDDTVPVKLVQASRGKRTRAEPIASLYENNAEHPGKIHHVGVYHELEEEMVTWTPDGESPNRMDALVWGLTELMLKPRGGGRMYVPQGRIPGVMPRGSYR